MKLVLTARFDVLQYDGAVAEKSISTELECTALTAETVMKALNLGDIGHLPDPFGYNSKYNMDGVFLKSYLGRRVSLASEISTEPIYGQIRFVVYKDGAMQNKWEYIDGNQH